jgi:DNA-binding response OmpR family regulator
MARILVADDHPQILRLLQRVLQTDAHEVITAADGEEALQKVRQHGPALVILDVTMPNKNGYEVLSELKADPTTLQIPVILLSGRDEEIDVSHGLRLGADWYLSKPFRPGEILSLARRFLASAPVPGA